MIPQEPNVYKDTPINSRHVKPERRLYDGYTLEEKVDEALFILDSLMYAFPEGPSKHREIHETWMRSKKAEARFWEELKLDLAKKGAWGILLILVGLIVVGLLLKLGVKV